MLDIRAKTFLMVCEEQSFTKAARRLFISQPAVSKQIQSLEKEWNVTLFSHQNRKWHLTPEGERLHAFLQHLSALEKQFRDQMHDATEQVRRIHFGATRTIGEFTLAPVLAPLMRYFKDKTFQMHVENTRSILSMLDEGSLLFALVEGLFDQEKYQTMLYKRVPFVAVASAKHPLAKRKKIVLKDLMAEEIIVREMGSGSRLILERSLHDCNFGLDSFAKVSEMGNVNIIKRLVAEGMGISFMYQDAALAELHDQVLVKLDMEDYHVDRDFNLVFLKENDDLSDIVAIFDKIKEYTVL